MPLIIPANTLLPSGYNIDNSVKINIADSAYFAKTPTAGDRAKWTFSVWFKLGSIPGASSTHGILVSGAGSADQSTIRIDGQVIDWVEYDQSDGATEGRLVTNRLIRDPTAWYHLVCTWDSDNGTAGNRMIMYINGVRETSFSTDTNPGSGYDSAMNNNVLHEIGRQSWNSSQYFDGYFAEMAFCDGQAYAASDFGEFDEDSPTIWKPKDISTLTFGSQGWYLDFEDSADLDDDESGNTNDWTLANITASDQMLDSPTNNFTLWNVLAITNPSLAYSGYLLDKGNIRFRGSTEGTSSMSSTFSMSGGKWYTEFYVEGSLAGGWPVLGVTITSYISALQNVSNYQTSYVPGPTANSHVDLDGGNIIKFGTSSAVSGGTACSDGDVIGIAVDIDAGKWWFAVNNTWSGSGDPAAGSNPIDTFTAGTELSYWMSSYSGTAYIYINAGQDSTFDGEISEGGNADGNGYGDFKYAPPSGFLALCTKNLGSAGG